MQDVQAMYFGTTAAAICAGGQPGPDGTQFDNAVEYYGMEASWTELGQKLIQEKQVKQDQDQALQHVIFGGFTSPNTVINETESCNGSVWTEFTSLSTSRKELGGAGATSASALAFMGAKN